jgi:hypothetical protein
MPDGLYCLRTQMGLEQNQGSGAWLNRHCQGDLYWQGADILNFMTQIENRNRIPVSIFLSVANFPPNFAARHRQMPWKVRKIAVLGRVDPVAAGR